MPYDLFGRKLDQDRPSDEPTPKPVEISFWQTSGGHCLGYFLLLNALFFGALFAQLNGCSMGGAGGYHGHDHEGIEHEHPVEHPRAR